MKKFVFIDTNFCNDDGSCRIHELEIKRSKLKEGDFVTAYQETDEWDAQIVRCGEQWGAVPLSETKEISTERYEGHTEGLHWGTLVEKLRTLRVLEDLGLPDDLLEEANRRLQLS